MLIAELRRKLLDLEDLDARDDDLVEQLRRLLSSAKEDLLTADVFGVLKYLPRRPYMTALFEGIAERNPDARDVGTWRRDAAGSADWSFDFWPTYPSPDTVGGESVEPDVVLHSPEGLVFVEAKLHSGFGVQQIEKQLLTGLEQAGQRPFCLLLVTRGSRPPRFKGERGRLGLREYLERADDLPDAAARAVWMNAHRVCWTNWQGILRSIEAAHMRHVKAEPAAESVRCAAELLADLKALMAMRQLLPFRGVGRQLPEVSNGRAVIETLVLRTTAGGNDAKRKRPELSLARVAAGREPKALLAGWLCPRPAQQHIDLTRVPKTHTLPWGFRRSRRKPAKIGTGRFRGFCSMCTHRPAPLSGWTPLRIHGQGTRLTEVVGGVTFEELGLQLLQGVRA